MVLRAVGLWFVLLMVAIANGGVRVGWFIPRFGDYAGHIISTLSLSALLLLVARLASGWLGQQSLREALVIGGLWVLVLIATFVAPILTRRAQDAGPKGPAYVQQVVT